MERFITEDLLATPIKQPEGSPLVLGPDGIKRNPEVEPLLEAEKGLTAAQLYQSGLTHFRQVALSVERCVHTSVCLRAQHADVRLCMCTLTTHHNLLNSLNFKEGAAW